MEKMDVDFLHPVFTVLAGVIVLLAEVNELIGEKMRKGLVWLKGGYALTITVGGAGKLSIPTVAENEK